MKWLALALVAVSMNAQAWVPNEEECKVRVTYGSMGINMTGHTINESCMTKQRVNAGLKWCARHPNGCSEEVVVMYGYPIKVMTPDLTSPFYE